MTDDDQLYLVSNNHVIGRSNAAVIGESVVQPGTLDLTVLELSLLPSFNDLVRGVVQVPNVKSRQKMEYPRHPSNGCNLVPQFAANPCVLVA